VANVSAVAPLPRTASRWLGLSLLALLALTAAVASLAIGSLDIAPGVVIGAFVAPEGTREEIIVQQLRVPRMLIALAAGGAFALAGAVMQGLTRNPLADPGILGIGAGASLGVLASLHFLGIREPSSNLWFAFLGAGLAGAIVYGLGSAGRGGASPIKLAIAGAALASAIGAISTIILSLSSRSLDEMRFWLVGSVAGRPVEVFWATLPFVAVGGLLGVLLGRPLNSLALGEEVAVSLGMRVGLVRALAGATVILLAGGGVAMAGPIAFVGLAVPHIARVLVGPDWRWILPYSIVIGGALLLAADVLGRVIVRPDELQVGVVVALVGAPFFVILIRRRRLVTL
jgi:iron complex transport system permease protein